MLFRKLNVPVGETVVMPSAGTQSAVVTVTSSFASSRVIVSLVAALLTDVDDEPPLGALFGTPVVRAPEVVEGRRSAPRSSGSTGRLTAGTSGSSGDC